MKALVFLIAGLMNIQAVFAETTCREVDQVHAAAEILNPGRGILVQENKSPFAAKNSAKFEIYMVDEKALERPIIASGVALRTSGSIRLESDFTLESPDFLMVKAIKIDVSDPHAPGPCLDCSPRRDIKRFAEVTIDGSTFPVFCGRTRR